MSKKTSLPFLNQSENVHNCTVTPHIISKIVFVNNSGRLSLGNRASETAVCGGNTDCAVESIELLAETFDGCMARGEAVLSEN